MVWRQGARLFQVRYMLSGLVVVRERLRLPSRSHWSSITQLISRGSMNSRTVTDVAGRKWACRQDDASIVKQGKDVSILCTTASVTVPIRMTVGWEWMKMADNGLARLISIASPVPRGT